MQHCDLPTHPFLSHPLTGEPLRALGFTRRGPIWPVIGAAEDGDGGDGGAGDGDGGDGGRQYTPPATQEELNRLIAKARKDTEAKFANHIPRADVEEKLKAFDAMQLELGTESEKAAAKARQEALDEVNAKVIPRVVTLAFRAEAKGVMEGDQLDALLEDLDLSKYANADGDPDTDKIAKKIAALTKTAGGQQQQDHQRRVDLGQGRQQQVVAKPGDSGRAAAARRGFTKTSA